MKELVFRPVSEDAELLVPKPKPAKSYIPDWYKKIPQFENGIREFSMDGKTNPTLKKCMPFLDTFTTGYIQETWCDIYIKDEGDRCEWRYSFYPEILEERNTVHKYPTPIGFSESEFAWRQPWIPQLPRGYSMIYTHPLNRYDLDFLSLTGIIDNDNYYMERNANHPFFIRKGFDGIIPKGTPMFQMIPFKRDSWVSQFEKYNKELSHNFMKVRQYFNDGYKKMYWQKKEYN